jgi:hypothetical protein
MRALHYIDTEAMAQESYDQVFELELMLGARPEIAALARHTQLIARRSNASSREETGR